MASDRASDRISGKNSRLYLLGAMLFLWCFAICGRLVYLQIFSYGKFVKQAGHQQQRAIPLAAKRGVIYDRSGPGDWRCRCWSVCVCRAHGS